MRVLRKGFREGRLEEAGSWEELERLLEGPEPAAVLSNDRLIWASGAQILRRVREIHPDCPVLMMTSSGQAAAEAMSEGMDDYILKSNQAARWEALVHTALKRADQLKLLRMFERALGSVSDGVFITDSALPRHPLIYGNRALEGMSGFGPAELMGKSLPVFHGPGTNPETVERLFDALANGEAFEDEMKLYRKDGTSYLALIALSPVRDSHGNINYHIGIQRDMTPIRHMQEQLRQSQKMEALGQLAGGVAHDFNNILGVILGYCNLLQEQTEGNKALETCAREVERAAHRAAALTRQLLAFSRKQVLALKLWALDDIAEGMEKMLRRLLGEQITLTTRYESDAEILGDRSQIEQVILNLAVNARDAMPRGGRLRIETSRVYPTEERGVPVGHYARLEARDTGLGIPQEVLNRIFEPFFTTKQQGGTGLGLATCKSIVQQMGGHILVESVPGQGASFHVFFPVATPAAIAEAGENPARPDEESAPAAPAPARGTETVLLVEDEASLRLMIGNILRHFGYRVLTAENAQAAIALAGQHRHIELVISDIIIPDGRGDELLVELRKVLPTAKCILTSGYGPGDHPNLPPGIPFLEKPFSAQDLLNLVRRVIDERVPIVPDQVV
jgi:PAS domain S-box-containing protein